MQLAVSVPYLHYEWTDLVYNAREKSVVLFARDHKPLKHYSVHRFWLVHFRSRYSIPTVNSGA